MKLRILRSVSRCEAHKQQSYVKMGFDFFNVRKLIFICLKKFKDNTEKLFVLIGPKNHYFALFQSFNRNILKFFEDN